MRDLYLQTIVVLSNSFSRLSEQVQPPQLVPFRTGHVYRFTEKTIQQALLLKLARVVTGLKSVDLLLDGGLLQEVGVMCRVLDEIEEDIVFLAAALTNDEVTELHVRYLEGFWSEEFHNPDALLARHKKPDMPRRSKINAYSHRILNSSGDHSQMSDVSQAVSSTYSGFVHASAPQVLDMYCGEPPHFHIEGMKGTPRMGDHVHTAWNYFYRGISAAIVSARAFGDEGLARALGDYHDKFLSNSGARAMIEAISPIDGKLSRRKSGA